MGFERAYNVKCFSKRITHLSGQIYLRLNHALEKTRIINEHVLGAVRVLQSHRFHWTINMSEETIPDTI